jgi:hypothetical protein
MKKKQRKTKEVKEKLKHHCPHCGKEIEIGKLMGQASLKVDRDISPDHMRKVAQARWNRVKLYGF